jgi:hypothetical protein
MLLYTIVPVEAIFSDDDPDEGLISNDTMVVEIDGTRLLVQQSGFGHGKVERIISTDPQHYLDPRWQPGSVIRW